MSTSSCVLSISPEAQRPKMLRFENCENPLLIFSVTNKMAAHFCFLPTIFFWFLFSESLKMILCFSTLNMVNPLFVFIARMPCWGFLFSFFFFFCNHPESFSWPFLNMTLSFYLSVETSPASVCGQQRAHEEQPGSICSF